MTNRRYYVMHFDCYRQSKTHVIKVRNPAEAPKAIVQLGHAANEFDPLAYVRSASSSAIMFTLEIYHPLSTNLIYRTERFLSLLESATQVITISAVEADHF